MHNDRLTVPWWALRDVAMAIAAFTLARLTEAGVGALSGVTSEGAA
jgi:hypothetical protein